MSSSHIRITETRSHSSSSKLDINPVFPSPLPQAPLMSFDLHFDTLKVKFIEDYLNNVTSIVNQQGSVIKTIIEELKTRVTSTEIIEVFASISNMIPSELGKVSINRSGDDWKDTISTAVQKVGLMGEKLVDLSRFKLQTTDSIQDIYTKIKTKAEVAYVKTKSRKLKKICAEDLKAKSELILNHVKEEDDQLSGRINELYKMLTELEQRTLWKLKDCEDLLKVRVNEKYVQDAINGLEEKLRKNLEDMNRGSLSKLERMLKELEKNLEKTQLDTNNKFKATKEETHENLLKKSSLSEHQALQKEVESLAKTLKNLQDSNFQSKFSELQAKIWKLEEELKKMTSKLLEENLAEEFENLKSAMDQIRYELDKKADKGLIADVYSKASEPKQENMGEKYDFSEFWKFREKAIDQIRTLELRVEKLSKSSDLTIFKKLISAKADDEQVKSEFSSHDFKILELDRVTSQNTKDIEGLLAMLKKLSSSLTDLSSQSGLALLGRKQATPQICLSCGRGDTNFAPIQPQIIGTDGKIYKADHSIGKSTKTVDLDAYETGAEVFALDTHEHAHFRRWEEHEVKEKEVVRKIPLNVIVGKEIRKSSSVLPVTKNRPQSAKK